MMLPVKVKAPPEEMLLSALLLYVTTVSSAELSAERRPLAHAAHPLQAFHVHLLDQGAALPAHQPAQATAFGGEGDAAGDGAMHAAHPLQAFHVHLPLHGAALPAHQPAQASSGGGGDDADGGAVHELDIMP